MSTSEKSNPRFLAAPEYILANFEDTDRLAVLVRSRSAGETIQRITTAKNAANPDFQAWLRHKNMRSDVYIGMNTLKRDAHTRTKDDIDQIRHVYLDIDHAGPAALEAIERTGSVPEPNYVLETSPEKFQVVWKVEGIAQDQAEAIQRAMVREFGGDPAATDSTRVLRLPGFVNRKYEAEHVVKAHEGASQTYHTEDFRLRADVNEDQREYRLQATRTSSPHGELSQSERDWAFAKRSLARGDDPEIVIQRIADYRADDKDRPHYYARHTVMKAQAEISRKSVAKESREESSNSTKEIGVEH
jgi:hypothetical protein